MSLPVIFISGPTSIGKSEFAIKLAKKIDGEIINADSMQVYNELKILTARPSEEDQKKIPHHLYGHISGVHRYNVAEWCNETISIINKNDKKNIFSIIVGGTGMYIKALLNGLAIKIWIITNCHSTILLWILLIINGFININSFCLY